MQKQNYQKKLEEILVTVEPGKRLLLHSCCAPCSSYCLEYLSAYFEITILYYNPNITDAKEYQKRAEEQRRLVDALNESLSGKKAEDTVSREERYHYKITFAEGEYQPVEYMQRIKGLENCPEGGDRCRECFSMRLEYAAKYAAKGNFDFFTTTLTISPLKNADVLNEIGQRMGEQYGAEFLPSDFKKRNGYKRSIELSREYDLYRQDYCGCVFSKRERMQEQ